MTSRGSIARASLKRTDIGHSKSLEALMVNIDWTSAKVVRIEACKDFQMQAATMQVLRGDYDLLRYVSVSVHAGQVLYFVESDGLPGWYYVLMYSEQYARFNCSCPAGRIRHKCDHQEYAMVYVTHRYTLRLELERRIDQDMEVHIEDDLRMAELEREFEHLSSVA